MQLNNVAGLDMDYARRHGLDVKQIDFSLHCTFLYEDRHRRGELNGLRNRLQQLGCQVSIDPKINFEYLLNILWQLDAVS